VISGCGTFSIDLKAQIASSIVESKNKLEVDTILIGEDASCKAMPAVLLSGSEKTEIVHSAKIRKIEDDEIFFLELVGLSKERIEEILLEAFLKRNGADDTDSGPYTTSSATS